nr:hypothetical protein [Tanacetum cinerariifolium]
ISTITCLCTDPIELKDHVLVYVPDPEEDPVDYATDGDGDDDEDDEEESYEDDDDEDDEHRAPIDSTIVGSLAVDHVSSTKETEPFEIDECAATPPPPPPAHHTTSRMFVRSQAPIPFPSEAEADIPPRKRLVLTAPTPRFEVGESSDAAARQSGSTVACEVDYSFVDTIDAMDTLRRYIFSMCTTHEYERVEAYQALARSDAHNKDLEAHIEVLETHAHRHEWKCQDTDDRATGH